MASANVDLRDLLRFHQRTGRLATVTAVRPPARFGGLIFDGDLIANFTEKPQIGEGWINGGFMVLEPQIFDYLHSDAQQPGGRCAGAAWRPSGSWRRIGTSASGSAWTRCAINACWKRCGKPGTRRGRCGNDRLLA